MGVSWVVWVADKKMLKISPKNRTYVKRMT